jgi:hypothetical protein
MDILTILYIINISLLILHEIESGYEQEWEILNLPGKIQGFLILHIPIMLLMFFGLYEIVNKNYIGYIIGIVVGIGGLIPFIVHKVFVKRKDKFNSLLSNIIIVSNVVSGLLTTIISIISIYNIVH